MSSGRFDISEKGSVNNNFLAVVHTMYFCTLCTFFYSDTLMLLFTLSALAPRDRHLSVCLKLFQCLSSVPNMRPRVIQEAIYH